MLNRLFVGFYLLVLSVAALAQPEPVCQRENIIATTPDSRFVVNDNATVTDTQTDLMWKLCTEGKSGVQCKEGEALEMNWAEALLYLPEHNSLGAGGYTDWRLPNIRELSTLVESQCAHPAINLDIFPNTPASHFWTSSPYHFYTHYSWYVDFAYGSPTYDERIRKKLLRLVRDAN